MISVIIPVYNEEKALPDTLEQLFRQRGSYEVLVVDGGSIDHTIDIARADPRVRLLHSRKGRGPQMNTGARAARGEWLLFLHADTKLAPGALPQIQNFDSDAHIQAGGFRHRFSGDDWRLRLISFLDNHRCERTRIMYGDQAMFIRRELFEALGGFPEDAVLEDVAFCEKLLRVTQPVLLNTHVVTDSRKFVQMGIWRSLARVAIILTRVELRLPVAASHPFFQDVR